MSKPILFYRANETPYGVFSNFDTRHPITVFGTKWETTEHAFQAMKFWGTDPEWFFFIKEANGPALAAKLGRDRTKKLRPDWERVKEDIMYQVVEAKFTQYPELGQLLVETGDAEIIEHTSNDSFWADGGDGSGQNVLGQILMMIRSEFKHTETVASCMKNLFGDITINKD